MSSEAMQPKVSQLENKSAVYNTVGRLQVSMKIYLAAVDETQPFNNIIDERVLEIPVKLHFFFFKNVLQGPPWTILGYDKGVAVVQTSSNKSHKMVMLKIFHLLQFYQ